MDPNIPSEAKADCAEVRGRPARKQGKQQHRTEWVLGNVESGKKERKLRSAKEALEEKHRPRNPAGKVKDLRHYFKAEG